MTNLDGMSRLCSLVGASEMRIDADRSPANHRPGRRQSANRLSTFGFSFRKPPIPAKESRESLESPDNANRNSLSR